MVSAIRRAVVLRRADFDSGDIDRLSRVHALRVVYTAYAETGAEFGARIAILHALEHAAEVVVVPHLSAREARTTRAWRAVTWIAELVTADGVLGRRT